MKTASFRARDGRPHQGVNLGLDGSLFDQVLSVQIGNHQFTDEDLLQGERVVFPGRVNTISNKIKEGEQLLGKVQVVVI